jgi:diacylglycerol kinase (ATP)
MPEATGPSAPPRVLLLVNPDAGSLPRRGAELIEAALASHGVRVETRVRRRPSDDARSARREGFDRVAVAGGDGSIRAAASATDLPVAILPVGTSNSVARSLGCPLDIEGAAALAALGRPRRIDLGVVSGPNVAGGSQRFLLCASAGLDAEAGRLYERTRRARSSFLRYGLVVAETVARYRTSPVRVSVGGRELGNAVVAMASNCTHYAGIMTFAPDARPDDGLLDLVCVRGEGAFAFGSAAVRAILGLRQRERRATALRARSVAWESAGPVPVQADGEPVGYLPVEVGVLPGAVRLVGPADERRQPRINARDGRVNHQDTEDTKITKDGGSQVKGVNSTA